MGIHQVILLVFFHCLHKPVVHADRNIKIAQLASPAFAIDKFHNIRMIIVQRSQAGAAPSSPLAYFIADFVVDGKKRKGTGGLSTGTTDDGTFLTDLAQKITHPAAAFLDQGGMLQGFKNALHGIIDGQDETGLQLLHRGPRIHQSWTVGEKKACFHETLENVSQSFVYCSIFFSSNIRGHSFQHPVPVLADISFFVTAEITVSRHLQGIFCRGYDFQTVGKPLHLFKGNFPFRPLIYQPGHFYKFMRYRFHTTLPLFINRGILPSLPDSRQNLPGLSA